MASPASSTYLAQRLGVSIATVSDVRRGKTWAHLGLTRSDDAKRNQGKGGSAHAGAVLTEADIPAIRSRIAAGETLKAIGDSYGVSDGMIRHIKFGRSWTHV